MVRVSRTARIRKGLTVPGLYAALFERERRYRARPDPRLMHQFHAGGWYCTSPGVVCDHDPLPEGVSPLLNAFEAGEPVRRQGRNLHGRDLPKVPLRRDQTFDWFEVTADDRVVPA